jgi:hypothetical protein
MSWRRILPPKIVTGWYQPWLASALHTPRITAPPAARRPPGRPADRQLQDPEYSQESLRIRTPKTGETRCIIGYCAQAAATTAATQRVSAATRVSAETSDAAHAPNDSDNTESPEDWDGDDGMSYWNGIQWVPYAADE